MFRSPHRHCLCRKASATVAQKQCQSRCKQARL